MALMALMMCFVTGEAYAYDIAVKNANGVTIYYNYINWGTELAVTYETTSYNSYSGSVVIPEEVTFMNRTRKVTSIGYRAFYNCRSLTSVTIPNSVTSIGEFAFSGCSSLTSVHITDLAAWCKITFGDNPLNYAHHLYLNNEEITNLVIPESVTSIGGSAFSGCSGLTSVTIPNSVTSIGERAFSSCRSLTSVTIPNSVTSIGSEAFYRCSGLTSVTIPNSVTSIGDGAFYNCSSLTSVTIPGSVTSIGRSAFSGCSGLTSVTIPNSVTSIGEFAFYGCSGLTSVTIPNSVTSIGRGAFSGCSGLTSVTIPNSVTSIEEQAFRGCSGLTSLTIGNSVTSIGGWAFSKCSGLTDVYCFAERVPTTGSNVFYDTPISTATLHVPAAAIDAYKTEPWIGFKEIVALTDKELAVDAVHGEGSMDQAPIYDLSGRRLAAPRKGINIVDGKKVVVR